GSEKFMISLPGEFSGGQPNGFEAAPMSGELSEPTGRYVVLLADGVYGDEAAMTATLRSIAGVSNIASASNFADGASNMEQAGDADARLLPNLGVAIMPAESDRLRSLTTAASDDDRIEAIEPEQTLYTRTQAGVLGAEYLR